MNINDPALQFAAAHSFMEGTETPKGHKIKMVITRDTDNHDGTNTCFPVVLFKGRTARPVTLYDWQATGFPEDLDSLIETGDSSLVRDCTAGDGV